MAIFPPEQHAKKHAKSKNNYAEDTNAVPALPIGYLEVCMNSFAQIHRVHIGTIEAGLLTTNLFFDSNLQEFGVFPSQNSLAGVVNCVRTSFEFPDDFPRKYSGRCSVTYFQLFNNISAHVP
jgi:hypothetical protein